MVFPIESEDKTLRKLLMLCQDSARLVLESYRKTLIPFDSVTRGKPMGNVDPLVEFHKVVDEAEKGKANLIREISEMGGILVSRDDFLRLAGTFTGMIDTMEALIVRLVEVKSRKWSLSKTQAEGLAQMSDLTFDAITKLRDGVMSLGFSGEKSMSLAKEIEEIERKIDVLYIRVDIDIATGGANLPAILIMRDVAKDMERLGDMVLEAADLVRILAL